MPAGIDEITDALQDYLEAILRLEEDGDSARVSDIASAVGVGKPAVTNALKTLSGRRLVNYEAYHSVTLTELGRRLAGEIRRRHRVLRQFLTQILGVDSDRADANACRMEHAVDRTVLDRLAEMTEFIVHAEATPDGWIDALQQHLAASDCDAKGPA
jgi:DtxR family Mn-dependent transcriptional regulator